MWSLRDSRNCSVMLWMASGSMLASSRTICSLRVVLRGRSSVARNCLQSLTTNTSMTSSLTLPDTNTSLTISPTCSMSSSCTTSSLTVSLTSWITPVQSNSSTNITHGKRFSTDTISFSAAPHCPSRLLRQYSHCASSPRPRQWSRSSQISSIRLANPAENMLQMGWVAARRKSIAAAPSSLGNRCTGNGPRPLRKAASALRRVRPPTASGSRLASASSSWWSSGLAAPPGPSSTSSSLRLRLFLNSISGRAEPVMERSRVRKVGSMATETRLFLRAGSCWQMLFLRKISLTMSWKVSMRSDLPPFLSLGLMKQLRCSTSSLRSVTSSNSHPFSPSTSSSGSSRSQSLDTYPPSASWNGQEAPLASASSGCDSRQLNPSSFSASTSRSCSSKQPILSLKTRTELAMSCSPLHLTCSFMKWWVSGISPVQRAPPSYSSMMSSISISPRSFSSSTANSLSPKRSTCSMSKGASAPIRHSRARSERTLRPPRLRQRYSASRKGSWSSMRQTREQAGTFRNSSRLACSRAHTCSKQSLKTWVRIEGQGHSSKRRRKRGERRGLSGLKTRASSFCLRLQSMNSSRSALLNLLSRSSRQVMISRWSRWWGRQWLSSRLKGSTARASSSSWTSSMRRVGRVELKRWRRQGMARICQARATLLATRPTCTYLRKTTVQSSRFMTSHFSSSSLPKKALRLVSWMFSTFSPRLFISTTTRIMSSGLRVSVCSRLSGAMIALISEMRGQQLRKRGQLMRRPGKLNMRAKAPLSSKNRRLGLCRGSTSVISSRQDRFSTQMGFWCSRFRQRQVQMFSTSLSSTWQWRTSCGWLSSGRHRGTRRCSCMRIIMKALKGKEGWLRSQRQVRQQQVSAMILKASTSMRCADSASRTWCRSMPSATIRKITSSPRSSISRMFMSTLMRRSTSSLRRISLRLMRWASSWVSRRGKGTFSRQDMTSARPAVACSSGPPTRTFSMMARTSTSKTLWLRRWKSSFSLLNLLRMILRSLQEDSSTLKKLNMLRRNSAAPSATVPSQSGLISFRMNTPFFTRSVLKYSWNSASSSSEKNSRTPSIRSCSDSQYPRNESCSPAYSQYRPRRCPGSSGQASSMCSTSAASLSRPIAPRWQCSCSQRLMNTSRGELCSSSRLMRKTLWGMAPQVCHRQTLQFLLLPNSSISPLFSKVPSASTTKKRSVSSRSTSTHAPRSSSPSACSAATGSSSGSAWRRGRRWPLRRGTSCSTSSRQWSRKMRLNYPSRQRRAGTLRGLSAQTSSARSRRCLKISSSARPQYCWMSRGREARSRPASCCSRAHMRSLQARKWQAEQWVMLRRVHSGESTFFLSMRRESPMSWLRVAQGRAARRSSSSTSPRIISQSSVRTSSWQSRVELRPLLRHSSRYASL